MQQPRQQRQRGHEKRSFVAQTTLECAPADLIAHQALQKGFRRHPEIEIRIELPAEALDIEQGFLQQHELRLNLDVEPARRLEKLHQNLAQ